MYQIWEMSEGNSTINSGFKICVKLIAGFMTFILVMSAGMTSKGALFFMTSQMGQEIAQLASGRDIQHHLKGIACWLWALSFSFAVPEILVFIHSLIICLSRRKLMKRPRFVQFFVVLVLESGQTIGMALLVGSIFPHLSVMHGILITNCVYLLPAALNFLSRKPEKSYKRLIVITMDALSFLAQLSGCLIWILIPYSNNNIMGQHQMNWALPLSLILISCGWWENHVNKGALSSLIRYFGGIKEEMKETRPFIYVIVSVWKIILFFGTIFTVTEITFVTQDSALNSFSPVIRDGFNQFWYSFMSLEWNSPFYIFIIQAISSFFFYELGTFACKTGLKRSCFALPVVIMTPVIILMMSQFEIANIFYGRFPTRIESPVDDDHHQQSFTYLLALSIIWFLSQTWITSHIWSPTEKSNEFLWDTKWYNSLLTDHSVSLNPTRNHNKVNESTDCAVSVFAAVTMWHETSDEMLTVLKSIFRLDQDQSRRRLVQRNCKNKIIDPHCYHYETHVFFDDAFEWHSKDGTTSRVFNYFVHQLIELMGKMNYNRSNTNDHQAPNIFVTPYGGRLEWTLPGNTKMTVHLKDKSKIRIKKRWSLVMCIDYLMRYEISNHFDLENTYLLTLDGDMDFRPKALHILVDMMRSQRDVAIACNRSHPTGSPGPMVWYQMFEYAVGFWLMKPCEYVMGNNLCAAGCFSIIRATVLLDSEIMTRFSDRSEKAHHFIQRDQGEDRWLCTLLIKRGYRIAYSSSSCAYTRCPETFDEFYNQRRRWILSIISNTLDLLWNCRQTVKLNPNISWIYMIFQALLLAMGLLCPGSIFLVLVNTSATIFFLEKWISLIIHSALIFSFIITCFVASSRIQLRMAKGLSALYGVIVAAVMIHSMISSTGAIDYGIERPFSLNNAFFLFLASCIFLAGCLHPQEIHCLLAGPIYLLLTPSMNLLLVLYSVINMNVVSWGTRDSTSSETTGIETLNKDVKLENPPSRISTSFQDIFVSTTDQTNVEKARSANLALSNWKLKAESFLLKQRMNVKHLPEEEYCFWKDLIQSKLFPFVENQQEEKNRISTDLVRLRNFSFIIFFMLNSFFVATVFGFQMKNEAPKFNNVSEEMMSSKRGWLSETNPAQLVVIFFAGSMLFIQFATLLSFRLSNLIRILSSTKLTFHFKTQLSHTKSSTNTGTISSNPAVLLSYRPTVYNNKEDSNGNHQDVCQINITNSWI